MYYYFELYRKLLLRAWNTMDPMEYGSLLIAIALCGWFCMKSGLKR